MKQLVCITCPRGCRLTVNEETLEVSGNSCENGIRYGRREVVDPVRVLTSVVCVKGDICCSVKTSKAVPKNLIPDVMEALKGVLLTLPIRIGDVVVKDVCGTSADWVATKTIQ